MKEDILKLRNEGKTYNEISKILGCSKSTVSIYCKEIINNDEIKGQNINIKNKKQIKDDSFLLPNEEIINKVIDLRKQLKSYEQISKELKISKTKIYKICNKFNLSEKRKYGKISNETINHINILYNEFYTIVEIGEMLKLSRRTVSKYIDKSRGKKKLSTDILKKNRSQNVIEWRKRTKQKLVEYKGGSCQECGYSKCIQALEFHHLDPNEKDFTISGKSWSFEKLKKEVDKCILVCNRCHTEIHHLKE